MSDIATALKAEITRLARKEIRAQIEPYKKAAAHAKTQVATLKGEIGVLKAQFKALAKQARSVRPPASEVDEKDSRHRFTAKGFATMRQHLGISLVEMGLLLDASDQSVRKWEEGTSVPREKFQQRIFALRGIGKRQVANMLEAARAAKR